MEVLKLLKSLINNKLNLIRAKFSSELFFLNILRKREKKFRRITILKEDGLFKILGGLIVKIFLVNFILLLLTLFIDITFKIMFLCNISVILFVFIKLLNRYLGRNKKVEEAIQYIIYSNKLYSDDLSFREINLWYRLDVDGLTIKANKLGDEFTVDCSNLTELLEAGLQMELYEKTDSIDSCIYKLRYYGVERIDVDYTCENNLHLDEVKVNSEISFRLSKQPHILISGITGSGKTSYINSLILRLLEMNSSLYIVDPKDSDLGSLKLVFGEKKVATDVNNICRVAREVKEVMVDRFRVYKGNRENYGKNYLDMDLTPLVLMIDELGAFRAATSKNKKNYDDFMSNITEIVLKGREVGVFIILSTQQPNSNNIPTEIRDNLSVRIFLGNPNSEVKKMVFDSMDFPNSIVNEVGQGYIYFNGLNSIKKVSFPYLNYEENFLDRVERVYLKNDL